MMVGVHFDLSQKSNYRSVVSTFFETKRKIQPGQMLSSEFYSKELEGHEVSGKRDKT